MAISTLRSKTGMSKDNIYKARNILRQKGRIDYRERKGNQSAIYQIILFASEPQTQTATQLSTQNAAHGFASEIQTQTSTQVATQTSTQVATQTSTINRVDKSRQDETLYREGAYAPAPAKFKKPSIEEVAEYCSQENLQMDHTAFYDYYEMNGWVSKKDVTIEWKSACRNWERRGKEFAANADKRKFRQCVSAQTGESSLDKQELARLVHSQFLEGGNEN